MAYELIPGIQQEHRGKLYQQARYPSGKLIMVPVEDPAVTSEAMQPVVVQSGSRLIAGDPQNSPMIELKIKNKRLYVQGESYNSLACFRGRGLV
jgi:hypothetical protein